VYYVYVILNEIKDKIYIGYTGDIDQRLKRHNGLLPTKQRSYTKINNGNWKIAYKESYNTKTEALRREKYLKSHHGRDFLKVIMGR
jgi:putative endonuclease